MKRDPLFECAMSSRCTSFCLCSIPFFTIVFHPTGTCVCVYSWLSQSPSHKSLIYDGWVGIGSNYTHTLFNCPPSVLLTMSNHAVVGPPQSIALRRISFLGDVSVALNRRLIPVFISTKTRSHSRKTGASSIRRVMAGMMKEI